MRSVGGRQAVLDVLLKTDHPPHQDQLHRDPALLHEVQHQRGADEDLLPQRGSGNIFFKGFLDRK